MNGYMSKYIINYLSLLHVIQVSLFLQAAHPEIH